MSYLKKYGTKTRMFQEGGAMPGPPAPAPGGPEAGGGPDGTAPEGEDQVIALAQATMQGDMEAAAALGQMLAPVILEQASGGAPAAEQQATPQFKKGGTFLRSI